MTIRLSARKRKSERRDSEYSSGEVATLEYSFRESSHRDYTHGLSLKLKLFYSNDGVQMHKPFHPEYFITSECYLEPLK